MREKNPKVFDSFSNCVEVAWVLISTFCTALGSNAILVSIFICFSFAGMHFLQWSLLTNKGIEEVKNERNKLTNHNYKTIEYCHTVAHEIKMQIANIPKQKIAITRNSLMGFLTTSMNSLEDLLTAHYEVKVRASIKLCAKEGVLKTYARGQNNVISRGGIARVRVLNEKEIHIDENYAYKAIIQRKLKYFAEGNLHNLSNKENDNDEFTCEYGDNWGALFNSTIIIPLRYPVVTETETEQIILGLICIDAEEIVDEWSNAQKTYAYRIMAFFADAVYKLVDQYMKRQEQQRLKKTAV